MRNNNSSPKSGDSRGAKGKRSNNASDKPSFGKGGPKKGSSFSENRKNVAKSKKFDSPKPEFGKEENTFSKKKFSTNERGFKSKPDAGKSFSKIKSSKPKTDDFTFNDESSAPRETKGGFKRRPLKKSREFDGTQAKETSKKNPSVLAESGIRLNKFIANSGICSRREADVFIEQGVVKVNGTIVTELGYRVQPSDDVQFDGKHIRPEKPVYLLLNKPKDYLTSMSDDRGRKTVMNLIKDACKERVYPVGRLDRNTMGLLLFTNDGELADKLMHPRKSIKKIYMAELNKNLKEEHIDALRNGIMLEDGFFKPDVVEYVVEKGKMDKAKIGVEIHSGRNRIVRRMFEHFGYQIMKLDRVMYGGLTKKNILRGKWRMLTDSEVAHLKML